MKLKDFINQYNTVIFDMDGVITQEQQYWNAAALTVWEFLFSKSYYGNEELNPNEMMKELPKIRKIVFSDDKVISQLKNKGVNSNCDLSYIVFEILLSNGKNFECILNAVHSFADNILDEYPLIAKRLSCIIKNKDCSRNGEIGKQISSCFQEWFLGDEIFEKTYGKKPVLSGKTGLYNNETPIINPEKLKEIFAQLGNMGIKIGIATGRPMQEAEKPLESFGIVNYIDQNSFVGYEYVNKAEKKLSKILTKPHPYMFLKAYLGIDFPDEKIVSGNYPCDDIKKTLAVGDAGSDILAAHDAGMDFCAVLTGVAGKSAKEYFEKEKAEYILNSLEDFAEEI